MAKHYADLFRSSVSHGTISGTLPSSSSAVSSCSSSSLECISSNDLQGSPLPPSDHSPLHGHSVHSSNLQPPLKLPPADIALDSTPFKLPSIYIKPPSRPPAPFKYSLRQVEHDNCAVKRKMGLMKLRRQGSHPPANHRSCAHGSFNQAAAARELMESLERLNMKEKIMGVDEERERLRETQRALLAGEAELESSNVARRKIRMKAELPLTAKIAAAMDAEGLIGVQKEICLQCRECKSGALRSPFNDRERSPPSSTWCKAKPSLAAAAGHGDGEDGGKHLQSKRRNRWITLRKLRSTRALFGKLWIKLKRAFSSSSKKHLQKKLLKVNT